MQTLLEPGQITQPPRKRPSRGGAQLRAIEYVLLIVGFICLGVYGYSWAESHVYQSYEDYELQCTLEHRQPTITGYLRSLVTPEPSAPDKNGEEQAYEDLQKPAPNPESKTPEKPAIPPSGVIGRIEIPRVDVTAIVREGVDSGTLRRAAGHVPGTALPGQDGNVAIAAHRDTFFRGLRDLRKEDTIRMVTTHGTYEYVVRSMEIVTPTDVQVLDSQRPRELTLITCYPFNYIGHAPKRYIVKADQVTSGPPAVFGEKVAPQQEAPQKPAVATAKRVVKHAAVHRRAKAARVTSSARVANAGPRKHQHGNAFTRLVQWRPGRKRVSTD